MAGITQGSWDEVNDGWNDVAVAKLNVDNGEVIWTYQVSKRAKAVSLIISLVIPCGLYLACIGLNMVL